jgi:hypothetical protein
MLRPQQLWEAMLLDEFRSTTRRLLIGLLLTGAASCGSVQPRTASKPEATLPTEVGSTTDGSSVAPEPSSPAPGALVPSSVGQEVSVSKNTPHLWMNARVVPAAGGPIAFAVVVPPGSGTAVTSGGVAGTLERLEGSQWKIAGQFGASLDFWGGFGSVVGPGDELAVPAIGLSAPAEGVGVLEFVMLPKLEPGRYRLRSGEVTGEFDVRSDAPALPPLKGQERGGLGLLAVSPALMSTTGGPITITPNVGSSIEELNEFTRDLGSEADVERWTDTGWRPEHTYPVTPAPISNSSSVAITLPALAEGMYRVVRHHPRGDLSREFWVTSELDAVAANNTSYAIAGWMLVSTSNGAQFSRTDGSTLTLTVTDLSTADPGWQPGASMEVTSRPTVRGGPAALVTLQDGGPDGLRLIVLADTMQRLVLRGTSAVTDADLIAAVEALEPFPLIGAATAPDIPGRFVGSVAQLAGKEGAATVTGWLVVAADGTYRLCDKIEREPKLRCPGPSLQVDASFEPWDPPPTTAVGAERVSTEQATVSGSLKGDILYLGVL